MTKEFIRIIGLEKERKMIAKRFDPARGSISKTKGEVSVFISWRLGHNGYCYIEAELILIDCVIVSQNKRVIAPCREQDVREIWEKFVTKVFERYADLKNQIIPAMDAIRSDLRSYKI